MSCPLSCLLFLYYVGWLLYIYIIYIIYEALYVTHNALCEYKGAVRNDLFPYILIFFFLFHYIAYCLLSLWYWWRQLRCSLAAAKTSEGNVSNIEKSIGIKLSKFYIPMFWFVVLSSLNPPSHQTSSHYVHLNRLKLNANFLNIVQTSWVARMSRILNLLNIFWGRYCIFTKRVINENYVQSFILINFVFDWIVRYVYIQIYIYIYCAQSESGFISPQGSKGGLGLLFKNVTSALPFRACVLPGDSCICMRMRHRHKHRLGRVPFQRVADWEIGPQIRGCGAKGNFRKLHLRLEC